MRVSVHFTGRFSFIAQKQAMNSPGYCGILLPNPPPTSGAMTRSLSSGTPMTIEPMKRTMCGFCVVFHSVSSPEAAIHCATAERGSIAVGMRRCCTMRSFTTTTPGAENAAATSPPATVQWKAWFPGALACSSGAPAASALLGVDHRRQRLVVDVDEVQGVVGLVGGLRDHDRDDVAHVAHGVARHHGVLGHLQVGVGQEPRARHGLQVAGRVGSGVDGEHAGRGLRRGRVDALDAGVRVRAAQHDRVHHAGQLDVVGEGAGAGEQARILAAADGGTEDAGAHLAPPIALAASCTERTMFW